MKKSEVLMVFSTSRATARAIGLSERGVNDWGEDVPKRQHKNIIKAAEARIDEIKRQVNRWKEEVAE